MGPRRGIRIPLWTDPAEEFEGFPCHAFVHGPHFFLCTSIAMSPESTRPVRNTDSRKQSLAFQRFATRKVVDSIDDAAAIDRATVAPPLATEFLL